MNLELLTIILSEIEFCDDLILGFNYNLVNNL